MAAPTRTADQREFDKAEIAGMMRRGKPRRMIIRHFMERDESAGKGPPVSYNQVLYDIKQVMGELAQERGEDNKEILATALEEIREIKSEAWQEWEASKVPVTRYTQDGTPYEVREPEMAYLRLIYDCVSKECELQGVKIPAPKDMSEANPTEGLLEYMLPIVAEALKMLGAEASGPQVVTSVVQQLRDKAAANTGTAPDPEQQADEPGSLEDYLNQS